MALEDLDAADETKRVDAAHEIAVTPRSAAERRLAEACVLDDSERAREAIFEALLRGRGIRADLFSLVDHCGHTVIQSPLRAVRRLGMSVFENVLHGLDAGKTGEELVATQDFAGVSRRTGSGDPVARKFLRSMADPEVRERSRDGYDMAALESLSGIARTWAELGILERLASDVRAVRALAELGSTRAIPPLCELYEAELLPEPDVRAALERLGTVPRPVAMPAARVVVDGVELTDDTSCVDLVKRAFSDRRGSHPMSRAGIDGLFRLYGALVAGGPKRRFEHEGHALRLSRAIAELLADEDVRMKSDALVFFGRYPTAAGAERIYTILDDGREELFRAELGSGVMWVLRGRALAGKMNAIERVQTELAREDLPQDLRDILASPVTA